MPAINHNAISGNRAHGALLQAHAQTAVGAGPVYPTEPTSTGTRYTPETPRKTNPCGNRAHGALPQAHAQTPVGAGHARDQPQRYSRKSRPCRSAAWAAMICQLSNGIGVCRSAANS
jgi:hypothetical protein